MDTDVTLPADAHITKAQFQWNITYGILLKHANKCHALADAIDKALNANRYSREVAIVLSDEERLVLKHALELEGL